MRFSGKSDWLCVKSSCSELMRDMLASARLSSEKPARVGSIETIFWLIDCSLVTPRQMELPELTTLPLFNFEIQCTGRF